MSVESDRNSLERTHTFFSDVIVAQRVTRSGKKTKTLHVEGLLKNDVNWLPTMLIYN